jgi:hypothetical protein
MKTIILSTAFLLMLSCVPYREFIAKQSELQLSQSDVTMLRSHIKESKMETVELIKKIELNNRLLNSEAEKMKRRLEKEGINSAVTDAQLYTIMLEDPDPVNEYYEMHMKESPCKNLYTAKDSVWLSKKEKEVYYYLNYARVKPREFCDKYVVPMLKKKNANRNKYIITLIDYMYRMKPLNAIIPNKQLFNEARCHAVTSGKFGYVGHQRQNKDCQSSWNAECCDYGNFSALEHVLRLLIDEFVPSLGHRYACLGYYTEGGIAFSSHAKWEENVVLDFK